MKLTPQLSQAAPVWRSALRISRTMMLPVSLGFLAYFAYSEREALKNVLERASAVHLLFSLTLWVSAHFIFPFFSAIALDRAHHRVTYATAFRIHAKNLPARYLPGGVWHTVGRFVDFRQRGLTSRQLGALVFLENSLLVSVALAIGGASVWYNRGLEGWGSIGAAGAFGGIAGLLFSPFVFNRWVLDGQDRISLVRYLRCIVVLVVFWTVAATSFVSYLNSFPGATQAAVWLEAGGSYLFSWGLGSLAVFAPQGIGVFEAVYASLLASALPLGAAGVLVGGFRLVVFCADTLTWLISRPLKIRTE